MAENLQSEEGQQSEGEGESASEREDMREESKDKFLGQSMSENQSIELKDFTSQADDQSQEAESSQLSGSQLSPRAQGLPQGMNDDEANSDSSEGDNSKLYLSWNSSEIEQEK